MNSITVIVFYGCSVLSAQRKIMLSGVSNSFRIGDSIRYDLVDMEKLCIPENDESTWDFSNLKYLGKEREVSFLVRILQRLG